MKWTYFLSQKIKIALSLAVVIALVLATTLLNERNFSELQSSFTSVYQDRLVVENYIYQMSELLHLKQRNDTTVKGQTYNSQILDYISDYELTKFTVKETELFIEFKHKINLLFEYETSLPREISPGQAGKLASRYNELATLLQGLSEVQVEEGKNLVEQSNSIVSLSYLVSRIEIIIIILVGLVIQFLVLSSRSPMSKFNHRDRMN